ncbi:MAG: MATE family efflux transporter [Kiritimatiellae bacterium]|nr:MATE family efflux transporter [Kiritimatiellia bacterium]
MSISSKHDRRGGLADAFRVIWPLMLSNSVSAVMQFTDRIFLSRYSDVAMQAAVPAGTLTYLLLCVPHVTVCYSGTFVAQFHGAGRRLSCARALSQSFWLMFLTVPLTLAAIPLGHLLMGLSGHAPDVAAAERTYFDIMMLGGILLPVSGALNGYFTGRGFTRLVMWISIAGSVANVLLDWLLIYGHWGFPELGVAGAAYATCASFVATAVLTAALALRGHVFRGTRRKAALAFDRDLSLRILRYGLPSGLHILLDMVTFTFFVFVLGRNDIADALGFGASNVCFNINHLVFAPLVGIGLGAGILVGNYQGAGDSRAAFRAGWSSIFIGWMFMGAALLLLGVFFRPVVTLFLSKSTSFDTEAFISLCRVLVAILASWCMFDVVNVIAGGALKGAGDTRFVMATGIASGFGLWVPMFMLTARYSPSVIHMWLTLPLYVFVLAAVLLHRWWRGKWRSISIMPPSRDI